MAENSNQERWFVDIVNENERHYHRVDKVIVRTRACCQNAEILELASFGRSLVLDGDLQSTERDEFVYHEALVHPAMVLHGSPKKVLVLGGGEGATLREALKWTTVSRVVMVDIDRRVVQLSREWLPFGASKAFKSKKAQLVFCDAMEYLQNCKEKFCVIISDLPSPIEGGPACSLYTDRFFHQVRTRLSKNGIFVVQGDSFSLPDVHFGARVARTLEREFKSVQPYAAFVPSFGALWGFLIASSRDVSSVITKHKIANRLARSLRGTLSFYDPLVHLAMFSLPKYLRKTLAKKVSVITEDKPAFIFTQHEEGLRGTDG